MTAPHLPPKTTVPLLSDTPRFSWVIFFVLVAALTSVVLTLATLVWFAPRFIPDQLVTTIQRRAAEQVVELDPSVVNKTRQRIWHIYDTRQKIAEQFYRDDATVLSAAMLSTDGWAVVRAPGYFRGIERFWEGVDYQGTSYEIESAFLDSISGLVYIKFAGESFPFISFADWNNINPTGTGWVFGKSMWRMVTLGEPEAGPGATRTFSIWRPQLVYTIDDAAAQSGLLINTDGELIGIVDDERRVIPSWMVQSQYANVLEDGKTEYRAMPWRGYMVEGFVEDEQALRRVSGFYVASSPTRSTSSTIGIGDVIVGVGGAGIDLVSLSRSILTAPETVSITVLRDSKEIDIQVKKGPAR